MSDEQEKFVLARMVKHRYGLKELINLKPNLLCFKCKEVALDPQICHPCDHMCCLECLSKDMKCQCGKVVENVTEDYFTNSFVKLFLKIYNEIGIEKPQKYKTKPSLCSDDEGNIIPNSQPMELLLNNRSRDSNTSKGSHCSNTRRSSSRKFSEYMKNANVKDTYEMEMKRKQINVNIINANGSKSVLKSETYEILHNQQTTETESNKRPRKSTASKTSRLSSISNNIKSNIVKPNSFDTNIKEAIRPKNKQIRGKSVANNINTNKPDTHRTEKPFTKKDTTVTPEENMAEHYTSHSLGSSKINKADISNSSFGSVIPKNIHKRNVKGETALHVACVKSNTELVRRLLEAGAVGNTRDNAGWTPLHEAVLNNCEEIVALLLQHGTLADVPAQNNITPLHEAVISNNIPIVKMLVKHGADINRRNSHNQTALSLAKSEEIKEALKVSNETIDEVNLTPKYGQSCILFYADDLDSHMIELLKHLCNEHPTKLKHIHNITPKLTHVIVKCDSKDVCNITTSVMLALVVGQWIINENWVTISSESKLLADLNLFEIKGTTGNPNSNAAKRSRSNAQKQLPGLFNGCYIYFHGPNVDITMNEVKISKSFLSKLIRLGGGVVLKRAPDPERIPVLEKTAPYHADIGSHLAECSHYIIYRPDTAEPAIKYNMRHIKTLPIQWLFECIENFKLVEPIGDFYPTSQTITLS